MKQKSTAAVAAGAAAGVAGGIEGVQILTSVKINVALLSVRRKADVDSWLNVHCVS